MAIKLINDDILQDIAEAIQEKDGGNKMTADQMASRISDLTIGNYESEDALIKRTIKLYENSRVTNIGNGAFEYCYYLSSVNFLQATAIGENAFFTCSSLASISFPSVIRIGGMAFYGCFKLTSVNFPKVTQIGAAAFNLCTSLTSATFPKVSSIGMNAFNGCRSLTSVILGGQQTREGKIVSTAFSYCYNLTDLHLQGSYLYSLDHSNAFSSTPIEGYTASAGKYGSIYVPASLYSQYISATNWTYFSSRFVSV